MVLFSRCSLSLPMCIQQKQLCLRDKNVYVLFVMHGVSQLSPSSHLSKVHLFIPSTHIEIPGLQHAYDISSSTLNRSPLMWIWEKEIHIKSNSNFRKRFQVIDQERGGE